LSGEGVGIKKKKNRWKFGGGPKGLGDFKQEKG